ncbi:MAG: DUF1178 family protein [Paracoccaceae bacterium]
MIHYALKCDQDHRFESWFQSASAFDKLQDAGMVACAVCGSTAVEKAVMAPAVSGAGEPAETAEPAVPARPLKTPAHPAELALRRLRAYVEQHSEDVGRDFAREARAIHAGEAPERPIHGEAKPSEARALMEEGVPVAPLPFALGRKSN